MNAVQRFIRSRVLLLTASILIVAMCLSVLVQGQSQAALNRTVDQNSRGLYDILVQAKADDNGGLMQPEIATGQGGISFDQLDALRKLSGTSVAAPISLVSRVTQNLESPRLEATDYLGFNAGLAGTAGDPSATDPSKWPAAESVLSDTPKKYRLTASAVSSDGQSDHTLFKTMAEGSLGKAQLVEEQVAGGKNVRIAGPEGETGIKFPAPAGGSEHNLFNLSVSLPLAPQVTESVVAVDPVSERALLGSAGDFLAPLEKAPPADARNAGAIGRHFESLFTTGIGMDELEGRPGFPRRQAQVLGAADEPVPAGQAQRPADRGLAGDPADCPLRHLPGPQVLGQDRGNRRLRQRHQGRRDRDPLAGQGLPAVRLQVPVRPGLARVQGPHAAARRHRKLQPGPLQPRHLEHRLRLRPEVHRTARPPATAPWTRAPPPATGSP